MMKIVNKGKAQRGQGKWEIERHLYENTKKNGMIFFEDHPVMRPEKEGEAFVGAERPFPMKPFLRDVLAGFLASLLAAIAAHRMGF